MTALFKIAMGVTGISEGQTSGIFLQGHISAVMQPCFNLPILPD